MVAERYCMYLLKSIALAASGPCTTLALSARCRQVMQVDTELS